MPEAPDLEVIQEVLNRRVRGRRVVAARVLRPTVLRSIVGDFIQDIAGRECVSFRREGKFLLTELSGERLLLVNPMLTGLFQYCAAKEPLEKRTCLLLGLDDGMELRYLDDRQMGMVWYFTREHLGEVRRFTEQGPDVLSGVSLEEFQRRLRAFHGEIKGILTRGALVAGIGNAYADEVLFTAGVSPFRKRRTLTAEEVERLHGAMETVVRDAILVLRERMGEVLHVKVRDFLQVHNKGGQPCPRCGAAISQLTANQRITSFCRQCQPGGLIRR